MKNELTIIGDVAIDGSEPGNVYVLRSKIGCRFDGEIELLHVVSRCAGGQIRGYWRPASGGAWKVRTPAYEGNWPEMDIAVATLIGEPITGVDGIVRNAAVAA